MKLIVYVLFGVLTEVFGVGVMQQTAGFFALLACMLLVDYLPD